MYSPVGRIEVEPATARDTEDDMARTIAEIESKSAGYISEENKAKGHR